MQGRFKAAPIESDNLLIHINRYIHLNPLIANLTTDLKNYPWSSYQDYIGQRKNDFCKVEAILNQFPSIKSYENFVYNQADYAKELDKIKHLIDP